MALRRILAILRRRWWIVLLAAIIAPAGAIAGSLTTTPVYESSADVLLSYQNLAGSLTGTADSTAQVDPIRAAETQAELARVPEVATNTLKAAGLSDRSIDQFLATSSVASSETSDLLTFTVRDESPAVAQLAATAYAKEFIAYRLKLDTAAISTARKELRSRIAEVRAAGRGASGLLSDLVEKDQTLQTLQSLQTSNATLVRVGSDAVKVSPRPVRTGVIALGLGLLVGIGIAFLREAFDTSVRSADEIAERLGLTLLARIPEPSKRIRTANRLVMIEEPASVGAEAFRMLRANLEFASAARPAHVIAITSAVNSEGKSTTAANLAIAFARVGKSVILIDLDLRRPSIQTYFDLVGRPGATDVVSGASKLDSCLVSVALEEDRTASSRMASSTNGRRGHAPGLRVLPSGALPHDAGEFVGGAGLAGLLTELRERADLVIVDTPPLLRVGDTMTMSVNFDAIVVVARVTSVSPHILSETSRLLGRMRAALPGVVVTGAASGEDYGLGYYGYGDEPAAERQSPRSSIS